MEIMPHKAQRALSVWKPETTFFFLFYFWISLCRTCCSTFSGTSGAFLTWAVLLYSWRWRSWEVQKYFLVQPFPTATPPALPLPPKKDWYYWRGSWIAVPCAGATTKKDSVGNKNAFNVYRGGGGRGIFCFAFFFFFPPLNKRGMFPVQALVVDVAWSD